MPLPLFASSSHLVRRLAAWTTASLAATSLVAVGTGAAALSNAATAVLLDENSPSGTLVQSIPMPTAAAGTTNPLTMSGTATSEGALSLSADGCYLTLAWYGAAPGTAAIAGTASATTPRVVARVAADGTVDTSTTITDAVQRQQPAGRCDRRRFALLGHRCQQRRPPGRARRGHDLAVTGAQTLPSTCVITYSTRTKLFTYTWVTSKRGALGAVTYPSSTATTTASVVARIGA